MNNYGLIVNEIGMRDAITELQQTYCVRGYCVAPLQSTVRCNTVCRAL